MRAETPSVVYVLPDKMGGIASIIGNLLKYRRPDSFKYDVVLTRNRLEADTYVDEAFDADSQSTFEHKLPIENVRSVLRRLARKIAPGPGVLVSNDWVELAMSTQHDLGRAVLQIVHGDYEYYYDLASKHECVVDAFLAYSRTIYEKLQQRLPHRRDSIFHLRYGIPIPQAVRAPTSGSLRLIFVGRLDVGKGIFDLPQIDQHLLGMGVEALWTIVGDGPRGAELRSAWQAGSRVRWAGSRTNEEVMSLCAEHDVFVLPTRAEGFPVSLLEAMAAGLVPVVSDIPSGVPEVVEVGKTGFLPAVGDTAGFATAIAELHNNPELLNSMSAAVREAVVKSFDIRKQALEFQALYANYEQLRRHRPAKHQLHYGSRLDKAWIPNPLVRAIRSTVRSLR